MPENIIEKKESFIFDVCDTLFNSNTTFDFLSYYFKQYGYLSKFFKLKLITAKYSPVHLLLKVLSKIYNRDYYKITGVYLLKNHSCKEVEIGASKFIKEILLDKRIESTFKLLEENLESSILLSSSIEPVIKMIAKKLQIKKYFATTIGTSNGSYTGHIIQEIRGIKEIMVKEELNSKCTVITDNKSDYNLLSYASKRIIVISNSHEKDYWNLLNPQFIYR